MHGRSDMLQAIAPLALAQSVDLFFSGLQNFPGSTGLVIDHLGNIPCRLAQAPEHGFFLDNIGIPHGICGGRRNFHELLHIFQRILVVVAQLLQLVQNGNGVDGLREVEHGIDRFIDLPVLLLVEILRLQNADNIRNAAAVDENRAENGLLRLQRLGLLSGHQFFIHGLSPFCG